MLSQTSQSRTSLLSIVFKSSLFSICNHWYIKHELACLSATMLDRILGKLQQYGLLSPTIRLSFDSAESILFMSCMTMILVAIPTFLALLFIEAPYGRYSKTNGSSWAGPLIPARVGWVVMESVNIWVILFVCYHYGVDEFQKSVANEVIIALFMLHYVNRSFIFPFRMKSPAPMTIFIFCASSTFCFWNSMNQAFSILVVNRIPDDWVFNPQFVVGVLLFFIGFATNIYGDEVLINLRKPTDKPGTYKIPYGGAYKYISCPNYAGECLEWIGFAMASRYSLSGIAFAAYTFANLAPRAFRVCNFCTFIYH